MLVLSVGGRSDGGGGGVSILTVIYSLWGIPVQLSVGGRSDGGGGGVGILTVIFSLWRIPVELCNIEWFTYTATRHANPPDSNLARVT